MTEKNKAEKAGKALLATDHKAHEAAERSRGSLLVKAAGTLSEIGDQPQLRLVCAGVIAAGLVRADVRLIGAGVRMLIAHEVATAAKSAIKGRVDRKRPRSADGKHEEKPRAGHHSDKEENSFPSGHSAGATAVACAFGAVYPRFRAPALLAASAVAIAQVPRRAHYPTDVGAGAAIGAASSGFVSLAVRLASTGFARLSIR